MPKPKIMNSSNHKRIWGVHRRRHKLSCSINQHHGFDTTCSHVSRWHLTAIGVLYFACFIPSYERKLVVVVNCIVWWSCPWLST